MKNIDRYFRKEECRQIMKLMKLFPTKKNVYNIEVDFLAPRTNKKKRQAIKSNKSEEL